MDQATVILLGCVGGLIPDVLRMIKAGREEGNWPVFLSKAFFWVSLILLVAIGGFAAWLLDAKSAKEAVAIGFAAPELLSRVGSLAAKVDRGSEGSLWNWWSI